MTSEYPAVKMKPAKVYIINAFVDNGIGGNAAGVVLDADQYSREEKQRIASRTGVSETAFVSHSTVADYRLEFFTPTRQIAHCGHATVATFSLLRQQGKLGKTKSSKETIDGVREIHLVDDLVFMEQLAPVYTPLGIRTPGVDVQLVMGSLFMNQSQLLDGQLPMVVSTGNAFMLVPVSDTATLQRVRPDFGSVERVCDALDLIGYYVFSTQAQHAERDAGTRMFAPRYGIPEESATGTAAGPLACYLHDVLGRKREHILIEQGHYMRPPAPSVIVTKLLFENERIVRLLVGGKAILRSEIDIS